MHCNHCRRRPACESVKPIDVLEFLINFSIKTSSYFNERFFEGRLRIFNAYFFDSRQIALLESAKEGAFGLC